MVRMRVAIMSMAKGLVSTAMPGSICPSLSRHGQSSVGGRSVLQETQRWAMANLSSPLSVDALAAHAGMSSRHFARLFSAEIGETPAVWVERARISAARLLLEEQGDVPKQVATKVGFASTDTLRRAFMKHVGITPAEYRKRFHA
ncbi:helix-turn-helix domain-containing protein [Pseudomonas sp. WAC2]|uniref:helix-turn-helix domain-containing protein n=1 Tax=Pseudomonas sp. WAC2 TaxID=3055057 RepID=UPI0025B170E9|nr:helix-turn-helix domain-containing protein [Pseudomonas sp. WAC2]MDN3237728.1 helix-turn-helix domain-containing protein [Pseudomonas sp. WAC2]